MSKTMIVQLLGGLPQSDWSQTDEAAVNYIKNKPDINGIVDDLNVRIDETKESLNNSISSSLEEAKSYSDDNLDAANAYTDSAVSQKSQVQIVTPEATEILSTLKIHRLTQEEYDEKVASGEIDNNALYLTPNEEIDLSNYATTEQLNAKADVNHNHDDAYYTETEIDELFSNKADVNHNHDSLYDPFGSSNDALASAKEYSDTNLENAKSYSDSSDSAILEESKTYTDNEVAQKTQVQIIASDVSEALSTLKIHKLTQEEYEQKVEAGTIDENALYLTPDEVIDLSDYATVEQLAQKADISHSHDDMYYTEVEVDTLLSDKASVSHNHDSSYDVKGSADSALALAKEYTDSAVSGLTGISHTHNDIYYTESEIDEKISAINESISNSVNEVKSYSDTKSASTLEESKTYADNAVAQKSLIQIVTWEADD